MKLFYLLSIIFQLALAQYCQRDYAVPSQSDPTDAVDGDAIIVHDEGDRNKRTAISDRKFLWPNGIVYYTIDSSYSESQIADMITAMYHWENGTCIRFHEHSQEGQNHINIFPGDGCTSYVGNVGCGSPQGVSVNPSHPCYSVANIIHELGHALGLYHEQRRPDRDDYVDILYENIPDGAVPSYRKLEDNEADTLGVGYDYNSIMHYTSNIAAKDPNIVVGRAIAPSTLDIIKINRLYNCDVDNLPPMNIILPPTPAPPTQSLPLPYPNCGEAFNEVRSASFESPNYPAYPHNHDCGWVVRIKHGYRMKMRVDLSLETSSSCAEDYLVIYSDIWCSRPSRFIGKLCGNRGLTYRTNIGEREACFVLHTDSSNTRNVYKGVKIRVKGEDINECSLYNDVCHHTCINTKGSYYCECDDGYFLSADKETCFDVNECALDNGGCLHHCHNYGGSYQCSCREGYILDDNGHHCHLASSTGDCDIDNGGCQQLCRWTADGAVCQCDTGYQFNEHNICEDINECEVCQGCDSRCGDHAHCYNTLGSYDCVCSTGYQHNGTACHPIHDGCANVDCGIGGVCVPAVEGGYYCECYDGYINNTSHTNCTDVNECSFEGVCGDAECHNTLGSYVCYCLHNGYQFNSVTRMCEDLNECDTVANVCGTDSEIVCTNTIGSYNCSCRHGYQYNPLSRSCEDVDECTDKSLNCDLCFNTRGSYFCFCDNLRFRTNYPFYDRCIDVNECYETFTGCTHFCANTYGSYYCYCREGYTLLPDGKTCSRN